MRRFMFRTLSQTSLAYRMSALGAGRVGRVRAGDRLPWVEGPSGDNHAGLDGRAWRAHVYGEPSAGVAEACRAHDLPLDVWPWTAGARRAGLVRDALYVLRPDGHVGFCAERPEADALVRYLAPWRRLSGPRTP
jgi:hypothetical protein